MFACGKAYFPNVSKKFACLNQRERFLLRFLKPHFPIGARLAVALYLLQQGMVIIYNYIQLQTTAYLRNRVRIFQN